VLDADDRVADDLAVVLRDEDRADLAPVEMLPDTIDEPFDGVHGFAARGVEHFHQRRAHASRDEPDLVRGLGIDRPDDHRSRR
jgi:hypothetical protein